MGGVDLSDQMIVAYNDHRKCSKVWKKIIYHIFHRIMLYSYILYCQNTSQPIMSRLHFTQSVIESLASTYLTKRNAGNNVNPQVRVKKLDGRKERDCVICSDRKRNIRRRSRTSCARCTRGLHAACLNPVKSPPRQLAPFFQDKSPTNLKRSRSHKISSSSTVYLNTKMHF